jgi:hypothetical protein
MLGVPSLGIVGVLGGSTDRLFVRRSLLRPPDRSLQGMCVYDECGSSVCVFVCLSII